MPPAKAPLCRDSSFDQQEMHQVWLLVLVWRLARLRRVLQQPWDLQMGWRVAISHSTGQEHLVVELGFDFDWNHLHHRHLR